MLTRDEIVRFGIDRRELVGDGHGRSRTAAARMIRKICGRRRMKADKSWRSLQWRLFCLNTEQFEFDFQRQQCRLGVADGVISSGGSKPAAFQRYRRSSRRDTSCGGCACQERRLQSLADCRRRSNVDRNCAGPPGDGTLAHPAKLSTEGLANAIDRACSRPVRRQRTWRFRRP